MLAHAFLVVAALTEQTRHPPPSGLIGLTCNEVQHLLAALLPVPPVTMAIGCAGRSGDADIRHVPAPVPADDKPPLGSHEDHDLRLEY